MKELPQSPVAARNWTGASKNPCLICNKEIQPGREAGFVHLGNGGSHLLLPGEVSNVPGCDEDGEGGMGWFPVGTDCARKYDLRDYLQ